VATRHFYGDGMTGDMTQASDLRDWPLDQLRAEALAQEQNFARGEPSQDSAGLELFRRAINDRDEAAWVAVVEIYRGLLVAQAGRQVVRGLVVEDDGFCVDRAFQRFWHATTNGKLAHFEDLGSILKYLKMCLGSVLLDQARARRRQAWLSIDDVAAEACVTPDASDQVMSRLARRELWDAIDRELPNARERLVAHLSFVAGLCPREILARHPEKFQDVFDVYRTKRNMIDRLRRSSAIAELVEA
jgi:DNA-directed RNA polymerase specialized sigma24 family protein